MTHTHTICFDEDIVCLDKALEQLQERRQYLHHLQRQCEIPPTFQSAHLKADAVLCGIAKVRARLGELNHAPVEERELRGLPMFDTARNLGRGLCDATLNHPTVWRSSSYSPEIAANAAETYATKLQEVLDSKFHHLNRFFAALPIVWRILGNQGGGSVGGRLYSEKQRYEKAAQREEDEPAQAWPPQISEAEQARRVEYWRNEKALEFGGGTVGGCGYSEKQCNTEKALDGSKGTSDWLFYGAMIGLCVTIIIGSGTRRY